MPPAKTMAAERVVISMRPGLRERVRDYRFAHKIDTEAEALRTLLDAALKADEAKAGESPGSTKKRGAKP